MNRPHRVQYKGVLIAFFLPLNDIPDIIIRGHTAGTPQPLQDLLGQFTHRPLLGHSLLHGLDIMPAHLMLPHQDAVQVRHGGRSLRGLTAGLLHRLRRKAPVIQPFPVKFLLIQAGQAPLPKSCQQLLQLTFPFLAQDDHFFHILHRPHAGLRPFLGPAVGDGDGHPSLAGLPFVLQEHDHHFLRQVQHIHPVIDFLQILEREDLFSQHPLHFLREPAVIHLFPRIHGAVKRHL